MKFMITNVFMKGNEMSLQITLKAARINARMTQADVAKIMHRSVGTIGHWENGKTRIRKSYVRWMAEIYDIPVDNLIITERKK